MAQQQERDEGRERLEVSLKKEREKRQECEHRLLDMERKLQRLSEKNKEKETNEVDDGKKEEKQKVSPKDFFEP